MVGVQILTPTVLGLRQQTIIIPQHHLTRLQEVVQVAVVVEGRHIRQVLEAMEDQEEVIKS